jgi:hypothetical protein
VLSFKGWSWREEEQDCLTNICVCISEAVVVDSIESEQVVEKLLSLLFRPEKGSSFVKTSEKLIVRQKGSQVL